MKLYSYVVASDNGSAPNPFWGYCTLAICKPMIRASAKVGDWIVGIGAANGLSRGKLIYVMQVEEVLPMGSYFIDPRFAAKKPYPQDPDWKRQRGDNQYSFVNGAWLQLAGPHSPSNREKDLRGLNVLMSQKFYYFGCNAVEIPERFMGIAAGGRGHRNWFPEDMIELFTAWLKATYRIGIHGDPAIKPAFRTGPCTARDCDGRVTKVSADSKAVVVTTELQQNKIQNRKKQMLTLYWTIISGQHLP